MALTEIDHVGENDEMAQCIDSCFTAAQACEWCADECGQFDAEHCQVCADVLRDCAESCRNMASA